MKKFIALFLITFALSANAQIPEGYYDTAEGLSGDELKAALHDIIDNHTTYPYTSSSTDVWDILKESDRDPGNQANVILIYTGWSVDAEQEYNNGNGWTREHVWAKSHGDFGTTPPAGTDAHHLRPCENGVNSSRSDKDFDNGGTQHTVATECYYTSDTWEPRDAVKGDVARMMFYMAVRYEGDTSGEPDLELVDQITSYPNPVFGVLSTLLQWNEDDPVDDFERNRNEVVFSYQGNRNPFIDHPEYVNAMYGVQNSAPVIENQEFTIAENSETGTEVGTVAASDPDHDDIIFSITSGNTDNAFNLNETSGLLTVNNSGALDYETNPLFNLTVNVNDGSASSEAVVTVNVDNVNNVIPIAAKLRIKVYPNPSSEVIYVKKPSNYSIEIYSVIGKRMLSTINSTINIRPLNSGVYFVVIQNEYGDNITSIKLLKK